MKRRPRAGGGRRPAGKPREDAARRRDDHRFRAELVGVATGLVVAVVAVLTFALSRGSDDAPPPAADAGRVTLGQVDVDNDPDRFQTGDAGEIVRRPARLPSLDLTLLNGSPRRVLVTRARVEILERVHLPVCLTQGEGGSDVPVSGDYTIVLPIDPWRAERMIVKPLHQQIGPDESNRIVLRFTIGEDVWDGSDLYALRLRLQTSDGPIDAGRFLLAAPASIERRGLTLPESDELLGGPVVAGALTLGWTWCFRRNLAELRRFLALPGRRSSSLRALRDVTPAPLWATARDRTPAAAAAISLLGDDNPDKELAVFAAQQTGDEAYVEQIRRGVVEQLLSHGQQALDSGYGDVAAGYARRAQAVKETSAGADLLAAASHAAH